MSSSFLARETLSWEAYTISIFKSNRSQSELIQNILNSINDYFLNNRDPQEKGKKT